ncbi:MAG TPA: formate/nitrite transporter family protein [Vicinamibacterales bacterium]|nr:formate/nitrite transporter family protein [Vicinamibacterales bacterium]
MTFADGSRVATSPVAEVQERSSPTGTIVYHAVRKEGEDELERTSASLAWSGLAAGLSMGFSFAAEGLLRSALPDTPWRPLVAKFGYTLGFLIVVLGRQQLFTENTLTVILPLLRRRDRVMVQNVGRLWAIVLAANLVGAALFAIVAAWSPAFEPSVRDALLAIGSEAMSNPFATTLLRGVYAGWLIALMVWLLPFAESARVWVIVMLTYIVGVGQFSHVIAGSVESLYAVAVGARSFQAYVTGYLAPSLLGNIAGGVSLVAAIAHAQFVAGVSEAEV